MGQRLGSLPASPYQVEVWGMLCTHGRAGLKKRQGTVQTGLHWTSPNFPTTPPSRHPSLIYPFPTVLPRAPMSDSAPSYGAERCLSCKGGGRRPAVVLEAPPPHGIGMLPNRRVGCLRKELLIGPRGRGSWVVVLGWWGSWRGTPVQPGMVETGPGRTLLCAI